MLTLGYTSLALRFQVVRGGDSHVDILMIFRDGLKCSKFQKILF